MTKLLFLTAILVCLWINVCHATSKNHMNRIYEGIEVKTKGPLYPIAANWTTAVYLEPPSVHHSLLDSLQALQGLIYNYNFTDWLSTTVKNTWIMRVNHIKQTLHVFPRRQKRSPFGFIGQLSHTLFGTVTEEELAIYKKALLQLGQAVNGTIHINNRLMSVTRQVHAAVTHNSQHIRQLRQFLHKFRTQVANSQLITTHHLDRLERRSVISDMLATLEQATAEVSAQMSNLHAWKQALARNQLDDSILPPAQLATILQTAISRGYKAPSLEWIYAFVHITPIWKEPSRLFFKVSLPLYTSTSRLLVVLLPVLAAIYQTRFEGTTFITTSSCCKYYLTD